MHLPTKELSVPCPQCGADAGTSCTTEGGNPSVPHALRRAASMTENEQVQAEYERELKKLRKRLEDLDKKLETATDRDEVSALSERRKLVGELKAMAKETFQLRQLAITTRQADEITNLSGNSGNGISRASVPPVPPARPDRKPN